MFYGGGPGLLIHPVWQISNAYFTALRLEQEPRPDYVRYSFEFRERYDEYSEALSELSGGTATGAEESAGRSSVHLVAGGDTMWAIALRYGVPLAELLAANPGIKNPNLIRVGERVVVPC